MGGWVGGAWGLVRVRLVGLVLELGKGVDLHTKYHLKKGPSQAW